VGIILELGMVRTRLSTSSGLQPSAGLPWRLL
jgi:hypothetical protein